MNEDITYIKQYIKTFNDRRLREEYRLYTSLEKPTILENYFKDFIKQEINTRGIGVWLIYVYGAEKILRLVRDYLLIEFPLGLMMKKAISVLSAK